MTKKKSTEKSVHKCKTCGYKEIIVEGIKGCPHCEICVRCAHTTAKCKCLEGE